MASTRKMKRKRLRFHGSSPGDSNHVDIPVIEEISFKDPKTNEQEYGFRFKNNENDTRTVRVQKVRAATKSGGSVSYNDALYMDVERIKSISFKDPKTNMQEYGYRLRNTDPPPLTPEGDDGGNLRHRKVQYVRYTKDNTAGGTPWVDVEQYVEFEVKDPKTDMQEFVYRLNWGDFESLPKITDVSDPYANNPDFVLRLGFCDPGLEMYPEIAEAPGGIDPPFRFDPFQNVVNISSNAISVTWHITLNNTTEEGIITCAGDPTVVQWTSEYRSDLEHPGRTISGGVVNDSAFLSGNVSESLDDLEAFIPGYTSVTGSPGTFGGDTASFAVRRNNKIDGGCQEGPTFDWDPVIFNVGGTTVTLGGSTWVFDVITGIGSSADGASVQTRFKPQP